MKSHPSGRKTQRGCGTHLRKTVEVWDSRGTRLRDSSKEFSDEVKETRLLQAARSVHVASPAVFHIRCKYTERGPKKSPSQQSSTERI